METNEKTSSIDKFFAVVSFFGSVIVSFITEVKMIYIVSILLCIVGIIMCVKSFKHGLILGIILTIITMCILRSLADSDAFQSGRCAAHNGRPETLAIIN